MKINQIYNVIELLGLNVIGVSVTAWLVSSIGVLSTVVACFVGVSVLVLNIFKIYVFWRDKIQKAKTKEKK